MKEIWAVGVQCDLKRVLLDIGLIKPEHSTTGRPDSIFNIGLSAHRVTKYAPIAWDGKILNQHLMFNKLRQNEALYEAGIPVPEVVKVPMNCQDYRDGWLLKPYNSHGGRGVADYNGDTATAWSRFYLQKKISKVREFRTHVALWHDPQCFTIQEKKPKSPTQEGYKEDAEEALCWNLKSGWWYTRLTRPSNHKERIRYDRRMQSLDEISTRTIECLGYDFGAIDIIMDAEGHFYVLEVNSHPGLMGRSPEIYAEVFGRLLNE